MSTGRGNGTPQGRVARPTITSTRSSASPLTPRLAPNATAPKRDPSPPKRPYVKSASVTRSTSPEKAYVTPVRAFVNDNNTPRSSIRGKAKPGSASSTPGASTPGSVKSGSGYVSPRVAGYQTPTEIRNGPRVAASSLGVQQRDVLSPLAQDPLVASGYFGNQEPERTSPKFFHASEAPSREKPVAPVPPPIKRANNSFFHANGDREQQALQMRGSRPASPALSSFGDRMGPAARPLPTRAGTSELGVSMRPGATPPSSGNILMSRSPYGTSPLSHSPPVLSPSIQKADYLNTPYAALNNPKTRPDRTYFEHYSPRSPGTPGPGMTYGLASVPEQNAQSPNRHIKSSSICALPTESPNSTRKRSATWAEAQSPISALPGRSPGADRSEPSSPTARRNPGILTSPGVSDNSPSREVNEFAADARRERKVLDLEISNSSLLAYNRSLEREIKKQKGELKRYRRLSRAGRFSAAVNGDFDGSDDETELPHLDGSLSGRPSSPFEEDVSDLDDFDSDEDATSSSVALDRNSKEARQRAKDEAQLKADLRKHRELLLDTARMNRSLQRCLAWTEDLIKDGQRALERKEEVQLGGRVLDEDEDEDEATAEEEDEDDDELEEGDLAAEMRDMEAFLSIGAQRDSGVELEKRDALLAAAATAAAQVQ